MRPRAAQQLGGQVVAHARDVELLLDRLAQTCESLAAWVRRCGVAQGARLKTGGALCALVQHLLQGSGHAPCSETPMATLAFLPALPAGTLGSRNACVGGDGFTSRGECQG